MRIWSLCSTCPWQVQAQAKLSNSSCKNLIQKRRKHWNVSNKRKLTNTGEQIHLIAWPISISPAKFEFHGFTTWCFEALLRARVLTPLFWRQLCWNSMNISEFKNKHFCPSQKFQNEKMTYLSVGPVVHAIVSQRRNSACLEISQQNSNAQTFVSKEKIRMIHGNSRSSQNCNLCSSEAGQETEGPEEFSYWIQNDNTGHAPQHPFSKLQRRNVSSWGHPNCTSPAEMSNCTLC